MLAQLKQSQLVRIVLVAFLIVILQIPTVMLHGIINDRQTLRKEAIGDITTKWGASQTLIGPRLTVPYVKRQVVNGKEVSTTTQTGVFLPETLNLSGTMASEVRYRGIFEVPVYKMDLEISGEFKRPDFSSWNVEPEDIQWDQAELSLQVSDTHAIQNQANVGWQQVDIPFAPGLGKFGGNQSGIHATLQGRMDGESFPFKVPITINGSERVAFAPFGQVTTVKLQGNWANPSFQGLWLPIEREVNAKGFTASWDIPSLGRNYPQRWTNEQTIEPGLIDQSVFGMDLISPVDNYRMAQRSIKYNFLFLVLTFATLWLFEVKARLNIHPLQYLMVGIAMCLFYLLQLAIAEHLGFAWAYLISTVAVVMLITAYSVAVLKAKGRGGIVGIMQTALYGYLFIVLANQDFALLIGSLGLFGFLAIAMYLTRNMNWFTFGEPSTDPSDTPPEPPLISDLG